MKKVFIFVWVFIVCSVFCFAQNIIGRWEKNFENGSKIVLIFNEDFFIAEGYYPDSQKTQFPRVEYFAQNNILRLFDSGGTGIYSEPMRFEYYVDRNTLVLIALNPGARVSRLEGRYSKMR